MKQPASVETTPGSLTVAVIIAAIAASTALPPSSSACLADSVARALGAAMAARVLMW